MPRFKYTAIGPKGKPVKGTLTAESSYAARKHLRARSLHPTDIKQSSGSDAAKKTLSSMFNRSCRSQVFEFTRQLGILLDADIKLTEALGVLVQQITDKRFRNAISDICDRVVTGESFADAIAEYTDFFDIIYISMIRVGEVTGTLNKSLNEISAFMEKRQRTETKVITAMIYPIILVFVCMAAIIILTTQVIPKITEQITKSGQELPGITKAIMGFSYLLINWWWAILLVIFFIVYFSRKFCATEKGAMLRDRMLLSLPVLGGLIRQRVVARFASTLSTLLESGLSMAEGLRVVAKVTGNAVMIRSIKSARERILSGADISTPLKESGVIDPTVAHMIGVGEKTGDLETMLKKISENLESSSDVVIERISAIIEPLIIVVMAAVVGVIAYGTILPILRLSAG